MDAISNVPWPVNEPVRQYQPGSHERAALETKIKQLAGEQAELSMTIGGRTRMGGGDLVDVVQPHNYRHVLGQLGNATDADVAAAIDAARAAAPAWRALSFDDRAAIFLKAADLLAGPWRATAERRHRAGPEQVALPGRDRRGLRADRLLPVQRELRPADPGRAAAVRPRSLEPDGVPAARRLRGRHHPVQLHLDRRQPARRPRADGQRRAVEAVAHPAAVRALHDAPAGGGRPAAGRDQHGHRRRPGRVQGRAAPPGAGRASTSPARPRRSSTCGARSASTSPATAGTRGWSARPAARTSWSCTPRRTRPSWPPR